MKNISNEHLLPVRKNGKYGYMNLKGELVIDFEFDEASNFSEGFAAVYYNEKAGYIDVTGNVVIPFRFDDAFSFSEGKAIVRKGRYRGYINTNGEDWIVPRFFMANDFHDGLALVFENEKSEGCFIDTERQVRVNGKDFLLSRYREGLINCSENNRWGFVNSNNDFIIPPGYDYTAPFYEGKAAVTPDGCQEDCFGFINKKNEMIIPPTFEGNMSSVRFSESLCKVRKGDLYGYINDNGILVVPYQFHASKNFSDGLVAFQTSGEVKRWGYADSEGNGVIEPIYTSAGDFLNGITDVIIGRNYDEYLYGYINKSGDYLWEPTR